MNRFRRAASPLLLGILVLACASPQVTTAPAPPPSSTAAEPSLLPPPAEPSQPSEAADARVAPPRSVFQGLGDHHRPITTRVAGAQQAFDEGLAFVYAFNHDEAIRSFTRAAALDPSCVMAHWGVAFAAGPHINLTAVPDDRAKMAWEALARAREHLSGAAASEKALVLALEKRYAWPNVADRRALDEAFASAMREVYRHFPDDGDIAALFAESLMNLRPWDLWQSNGSPQPGTDEIVRTLDATLARAPTHPLANHLYIHALEASPHPEQANAAAERLRGLQPGLGHMVHMPTHIDVRLGRWQHAIDSNAAAIKADLAYQALQKEQGFYRLYMSHNYHMLTFAAMMSAQGELAYSTIMAMLAAIPEAWQRDNAAMIDGYLAMPYEVLIRFGKWNEVLAAPEPAANFPMTRALRHYARGVAFAAQDQLAQAEAEQVAFRAVKATILPERSFGNNSMQQLLSIAENLLAGEILYRRGKVEAGFRAMRQAIASEDRLRYDEPPDWIQPVRHAYGAALLKSRRYRQAEAVYREDLQRHPNNAWSLHGLARSLRQQKREQEALLAERELAEATKNADIVLTSSCMCLPGV